MAEVSCPDVYVEEISGAQATIAGATALAVEFDDVELGNLNKIGINCLRRFDPAGIVCWGARTFYNRIGMRST